MIKRDLTHADIFDLLDAIFPFANSLGDDPSGWVVASPDRTAKGVAVALEATPATLKAVGDKGASLLIVHHPPIYKPLQRIVSGDPAADIVFKAIRRNVDILAAHTNADASAGGLNDRLCRALDMQVTGVIQPVEGYGRYKLVTFVPAQHADAVAEAAFGQGAGNIGEYSHCSFRTPGTGTFLPGAETEPFSGVKGGESREPEIRLEMLVPANRLGASIEAMIEAHPYEEVAYDVYPLKKYDPDAGIGRWAALPRAVPFGEFADKVRRTLRLKALRRVGKPPRSVKQVAVCTGSGRSLLRTVAGRPGTVYLTGELGYHDEREAEALGICVLEGGHFGTERIFIDLIADALREGLTGVPLVKIGIERDPVTLIQE